HVHANGVLLADGRRHLDTRLGVDHDTRDSRSELTWRGIGADRGKAVFHGGILIREGADGTDANLSNKNLLLSEGAEIDTQPMLVIHADEVQAAHGAPVGQLDPTAMFYLRSRGIPAERARALLTAAFCREPLSAIDEQGVRDAVGARLDEVLLRSVAAEMGACPAWLGRSALTPALSRRRREWGSSPASTGLRSEPGSGSWSGSCTA